jgi:hypothetical protein
MGVLSCANKTDGISKKHPQNRTIHEKIRMTRILNKDNLTGHHLIYDVAGREQTPQDNFKQPSRSQTTVREL